MIMIYRSKKKVTSVILYPISRMDMTKVFVATVKAIRLQMKSEPDLLNKSKKKRPSKFSMEAQNVVSCG